MKTKKAKRKRTGGDDLLRIADRVNAIARRAEHLITGRDKARRYMALFEEGKDCHLNLLLAAQACREGGLSHPDMAFATICFAANEMAAEAAGADPKLERAFDKLRTVLKAQGETFDPNDDDAWSDELLAVSNEFERRWEAACEEYFIFILRRHGEDEIADLCLNDVDAFMQRLEAGVRIVSKDGPEDAAELDEKRAEPDRLAAQARGDTPTSEVVPKG